MKTITPIVGILLVLISTVLVFATSDDTDVSCSPITGNPYQEKCGETQTHCNERGCVVTPPEDEETHTPRVPILIS